MDIEIKEVMTPHPHSVASQVSLADASRLMREYDVRHLPVKKGNEVVGILSERDIDFAARVDQQSVHNIKVEDACNVDVYIVSPTTKVSEVARTMGHRKIGCAVVMEGHVLQGIFTGVDACKLLGEALSGRPEQ